MKVASTVDRAATVCPRRSASCRVQRIWYTSAAAPERRHADARGSAARVAVLIGGDSSRGRIRERPNLISGIPRIEVIQCKKSVTVLHLGLRSGAEGLASRVGGVVRVTAQPAE